ncbi:hypothetical protein T01_15687 [Trichinella spiralis]|uniref:Uncharacterized protein n=1 Tax=Trichinella spiralis TaxID=6334 RepID=A0A0V1ANY6_TRISP|nr:hypothetical protein T01_15687 [Trichinella spiralis]
MEWGTTGIDDRRIGTRIREGHHNTGIGAGRPCGGHAAITE